MLGGEIVSADSRYLYRGLDIGTAKPSLQERARVPHHLIDVTFPDQPWSLAQYKTAATHAIAEIHERGRLPMLVGGTGQYIRAIVEGWVIPPKPINSMIRHKLEHEGRQEGGASALHGRLAELDARAAAEIDPRNVRRLIRALEVCLATGEPFSTQRTKHQVPYRMYVLGLTMPRTELYARIDARIEDMIAEGLVQEVRRLVQSGHHWDLPAMSALGYRQIGGYLRGEYGLGEAVRLIKRDTRRLVRQQSSWFSAHDSSIVWYEANKTDPEFISRSIQRWLHSKHVRQ